MYVLLNLKDDKMLQNVVQLLFAHGHRQLSIGETIENLCPTCEKTSSNQPMSTVTSSTTSPITPSTPPRASSSSSMFAASSPSAAATYSTVTTAALVVPTTLQSPKREFVCSTPIKNGTSDAKSHLKRPFVPISPILPHRAPQEIQKYEEVSVKEEPSDEGNEDPDMSVDVDEDLEDLTLSQALELFDRTNFQEPRTKKAKADEPFGELYQCQLCKKSISRHGQYANLLNHLSRHARLHASKKQYCCPKCGASFTRRYLASTHIKEVHGEPKLQPHDFAAELREEYRRLLEMCFPGADNRRKQQQAVTQATKDSILNILSDDSGVSVNDSSDLNISVGNEKIEVHVGTADGDEDSS
ncbi:C2H2-type domain-containing protein [Caenorhabditis elegans]|uniref:C2H2-type domain-containing protein n=1 Tax=Caenorhabditis elegans TaxID=6239 RepID=G5EDA0_CAEEL|nr:C2H2-type domain-containing protein [Caenorhabditis elegans]CAA88872.2 C2H2-type domain-containing protein [Caenorhabditis elegans]|eukprot:NP_496235.2 Zinc finger putative Transcription Factor family [Caenorhabditis elegans]